MDLKAKSLCKYIQATNLPSPSLFDDPNWVITINGVPITEDIEEALTDHIHSQALFRHLIQWKQITTEGINRVAWNKLSKVDKALPWSR